MSPKRLEQRIAMRQRLNMVLKMKEVCNDSELDEIIDELENELRRKEQEG